MRSRRARPRREVRIPTARDSASISGARNASRPRVRADAGVNRREGIGIAEAPRGTLIHHYRVDDRGLVTWVNLIIATGQNNRAMNQGVLQAARRFLRGPELSEGMLNRVEAVIRTFDPA